MTDQLQNHGVNTQNNVNQKHQIKNRVPQEKKVTPNSNVFNNSKKALKPAYPSYRYPSSKKRNMNVRVKANNSMYEIQQFYLDIKKRKKLQNSKNYNNNNNQPETILFDESEEATETSDDYYSVMENNKISFNVIKHILFIHY